MPAGGTRTPPGSWSSTRTWRSPRGFLGGILSRLEQYESRPDGAPGIVGFGLRNANGTPQGSVGAFPSLARSIREQFIPRSRRKYQPAWRIRPGRVDWVTGACMLINASLIAEVGGMDEDFFLYHEEVALLPGGAAAGLARRIRSDRERRAPISLAKSADFAQDAGHHPAQQAALFPQALAALAVSHLAAIVRLESAIRGGWSQVGGRREEARAWQTVARIARLLSRGEPIHGRDVLALAESIAGPASPGREDGDPRGSQATPAPRWRPARRPRRASRPGGTPLGR